MLKEIDLIENKNVREKFMARVEILDRVKELNTLADTDFMTTRQVAEFYEVTQTVVRMANNNHKQELRGDGVKHYTYKDIQKLANRKDILQLGISPNGSLLFPKRAVLRVGMLLRDSEVAKEVRTMLLNVYHDVQEEKPEIIENINKEYDDEIELHSKLGQAIMKGDMDNVILVTTKINEIKNRRLKETEEKLAKSEEEKKHIITNSTTIQETRQVIRRIINIIATKYYGNNFPLTWNEMHKKVKYKLGINIKNRGGQGSLLSKYTEEELKEVEKIVKSWGSKLGINLTEAVELA